MTPKDIVAFVIAIFMAIAAIACDAACIHWCVEMFKDGDWSLGLVTIGLLIIMHGVIAIKLLYRE